MVLNSQTPRAGMSRQYMSSRPRSGVKWRWVAAIALVVGLMYYFFWSGEQTPGQGGNGTPAAATAQTNPQDSERSGVIPPPNRGPRTTAELPPPSDMSEPRSKPGPVVNTLTIGQTGAGTAGPVSTATNSQAQPQTNQRPEPAKPVVNRQSTSRGETQMAQGMDLIREGRLVQGRRVLSQVLFDQQGQLSPLDAQTIRDTLSSINKQLVFSPEVVPGDPLAESYVVQRGEYLSNIAPKYGVPYQFVERINNTPAERLQAGKPIKMIKGPFHVMVSKSNYRMDIYLEDSDGQPIYVRSFPVGLGKSDSTPQGEFIVEPGRKVKNPDWRNPRTGEYYTRDDPKNPIGEHWVALKGNEPATESYTGYGIHGTVDPHSIGQQASMGCIRMRDDDVALVYDMLAGGKSTVQIRW